MGQQQSGFVVEIASPRLGRFQALPQKDPEDEERPATPSNEWRIISNPCSEMFGTERLKALIHRLYHQRKLFNESDARLILTALYALDPAADVLLPLLTVLSNATAHHSNQMLMREARITNRIAEMVCLGGCSTKPGRVMLLQCLANMAVAKENLDVLSPCIPKVIDRLSSDDEMEVSVAMQALTNLTLKIEPSQVDMYSRCIPRVLSRVWIRGEPSLDALRIGSYERKPLFAIRTLGMLLLVNLSCCPDMVPHILGAKLVSGILCVLDTDKAEVLMRAVTWILCMASAVDALHITYDKLGPFIADPFGNPSHTMYHGIFGHKARLELEKRMKILVNHPQLDIARKCSRLMDILSQIPLPPAAGFHLHRL